MNVSPLRLTAGPETRGLGSILRPYVWYSDGFIWATPGLYLLSEDYVLLNQLGNNNCVVAKSAGYSAFGLASLYLWADYSALWQSSP